MKTLFNMGQLWSKEEYLRLTEMFDSRTPLEAMCRELGRTPSAIVSKLQYLGKVMQIGQAGHYYPVPEDALYMWQEIRELDIKLKAEQ